MLEAQRAGLGEGEKPKIMGDMSLEEECAKAMRMSTQDMINQEGCEKGKGADEDEACAWFFNEENGNVDVELMKETGESDGDAQSEEREESLNERERSEIIRLQTDEKNINTEEKIIETNLGSLRERDGMNTEFLDLDSESVDENDMDSKKHIKKQLSNLASHILRKTVDQLSDSDDVFAEEKGLNSHGRNIELDDSPGITITDAKHRMSIDDGCNDDASMAVRKSAKANLLLLPSPPRSHISQQSAPGTPSVAARPLEMSSSNVQHEVKRVNKFGRDDPEQLNFESTPSKITAGGETEVPIQAASKIIESIEMVFTRVLDTDGDGKVSYEEFSRAVDFISPGFSTRQKYRLFNKIGFCGRDYLTFDEIASMVTGVLLRKPNLKDSHLIFREALEESLNDQRRINKVENETDGYLDLLERVLKKRNRQLRQTVKIFNAVQTSSLESELNGKEKQMAFLNSFVPYMGSRCQRKQLERIDSKIEKEASLQGDVKVQFTKEEENLHLKIEELEQAKIKRDVEYEQDLIEEEKDLERMRLEATQCVCIVM